MLNRTLLLAGTALAVVATPAMAATHKKPAAKSQTAGLRAELDELKAEVRDLQQRLAEQTAQGNSPQASAQVAQATQAAQSAQAAADASNAQVTKVAAQQTQLASRLDKDEHPTALPFKGIKITPGGFIEAAGIYRSRFQGDDIASNFAIPFPGQSHPSHVAEGRFSARQSRFSLLAEGNVNPNVKLGSYMELDFQGAAQTSNSNQSNSYVPRIRNVYATADWTSADHGFHVLAGQSWSLLTLQSKGITPRAEVTPPQIDAQYIPGFAWARQPGVRFVADFMDHKLWVGVAAENPQTTFGGTGVPAGVVSVLNGQGFSNVSVTCPGGAAAGTTVACTVTNNVQAVPSGAFQQFYNGVGSTLSLNNVPDLIGKIAYEAIIAGHNVHLEAFGIHRTFSTHLDGTGTNNDANSWGYGASGNVQIVPKILDAQFSAFGGRGIGRYGSAGLPDVTSDKAGNLHPIKEWMFLAGATLHATPKLDIYGFAGEEREDRLLTDGGTAGLGLFTANDSGCFVETATTATATTTCGGNTHEIRQLTAGFWDKFYQGSFGRMQAGIQYSYTDRQLFSGIGGAPRTNNNMVFFSLRYYPF